jgi:hypothetical protein
VDSDDKRDDQQDDAEDDHFEPYLLGHATRRDGASSTTRLPVSGISKQFFATYLSLLV